MGVLSSVIDARSTASGTPSDAGADLGGDQYLGPYLPSAARVFGEHHTRAVRRHGVDGEPLGRVAAVTEQPDAIAEEHRVDLEHQAIDLVGERGSERAAAAEPDPRPALLLELAHHLDGIPVGERDAFGAGRRLVITGEDDLPEVRIGVR